MSAFPNSFEEWLASNQTPSSEILSEAGLDDIFPDLNLFSGESVQPVDMVNTTETQEISGETFTPQITNLPEVFTVGPEFVRVLQSFCTFFYGKEQNADQHSRLLAQTRNLQQEVLLLKAKNLELTAEVQGLVSENLRLKSENFIYMPNATGLEFLTTTNTAFKLYKAMKIQPTTLDDVVEPQAGPSVSTNGIPAPSLSAEMMNGDENIGSSSTTRFVEKGRTPTLFGGKQPRAWYKKDWKKLLKQNKTKKTRKQKTRERKHPKRKASTKELKKRVKFVEIEFTTDED